MKTGYVQSTSYSSLEHDTIVNSDNSYVSSQGSKNAHAWFLKGKVHPNI